MKYEGGLNSDLQYSVERSALKNAQEAFTLGKFTSKKSVPQKNGHALKVHYWEHIATSEIQDLVEGVTPQSTDMVRVSRTGQLKRQGAWVPFTDELMEQHENAAEFHKETSKELGYTLGGKLEADAFSVSLNDAGVVVDVAVAGSIDQALKDARKAFRINNAPKFTTIKTGSTKVGTKPVNAGWYLFCSINDADVYREAGDFLSVEDYGYTSDLAENEIGVIKSLGIRIVENPRVGDGMSLMLGDEGLATLDLSAKNRIEYIVKELGTSVTVADDGTVAPDALDQAGSIGVKSRTGSMVLMPRYVCRLENVS